MRISNDRHRLCFSPQFVLISFHSFMALSLLVLSDPPSYTFVLVVLHIFWDYLSWISPTDWLRKVETVSFRVFVLGFSHIPVSSFFFHSKYNFPLNISVFCDKFFSEREVMWSFRNDGVYKSTVRHIHSRWNLASLSFLVFSVFPSGLTCLRADTFIRTQWNNRDSS